MAKKQVGLKFEEEDLARWDVWAESQGLTRTTLIETAVERLISAAGDQAPAEKPQPESQAKPKHRARPGIRRAWICSNEKCVPPRRIFLSKDDPPDMVPECPEHGPMMHQPNRPYFGQSTA